MSLTPTDTVETPRGAVRLFWDRPSGRARWGLVLAHGAGTHAEHPGLVRLAAALAARGFAVLRFNFPYAEAGRKPPDRAPVLLATWEAVWAHFVRRPEVKGLPRIAAGRSMGGRMASLAAADSLIDPDGLVFFAYPLYAPGRPERQRAAHLPGIEAPLLFVSGTRDSMAKPEHLDPVLSNLGNRATMYWIDTADHGFKVLKRTGRTEAEVAEEAADAAARWAAAHLEAGK